MADREARLRMVAEFLGLDEGADQVKILVDRLESLESTGKDTAEALQTTAQAVDQVDSAQRKATVTTEQAADALEKVGDVATETARETVAAADSEVVALGEYKTAAEALEASLRATGPAAVESAGEARTAAAQVEAAMEGATVAAKGVGTALDQAGDAGVAALGQLTGSTVTFESAAEIAANQVRNAWEQYNDTLRVTPRQLGFVAQAVEAVKFEILEAAEKGQQATVEQIATYEKLEAQLQQLTVVSNRLTNASKDNAVRLKETGTQVQGLAAGVQQVTAAMGPQAAKVGFLVGNVGQLGGAYENLKDSIAAMDLNTVSATGSLTKFGVQGAAIIGTLLAASKAGLELAKTNKENEDEWERLSATIGEFSKSTLNTLIDRLGATQSEVTKLIGEVTAGETSWDRITNSLGGYSVAVRAGGDATSVYYDLIRRGVSAMEAQRLATEQSKQAVEFFTIAQKNGEKGMQLWVDALRQAGGDSGKLTTIVTNLRPALDQLAAANQREAAATKAQAAAKEELNKKMLEHLSITAQNTLAVNEAIKNQAALETAFGGTTLSINRLLEALGQQIERGPEYQQVAANLATTLSQLLANTDGLTAAERARIEQVVQLAQRSGELTVAERIHAENLITAITTRKEATAAVTEHTAAVVVSTDAQRQATAASEESTAALQTELESIREQIEAEEIRLGIRRNVVSVDELRRGSLDELRAKEAALTEQINIQTSVVHASDRVFAEDAERKKELADALAVLSEKQANVKASGAEVNKVVIEGKEVYSNLTAAQLAQRDAIEKSGDAHRDVVKSIDEVNEHVKKAKETTEIFGNAADTAGNKARDLGTKTQEGAAGIAAALKSVGESSEALPEKFAALIERLPTLDEYLKNLERTADGVASAMQRAAEGIDAANQAAARAAE